MKVINFYNVKGGVGKSSLAYLTGYYLATQRKKVLFVDLDPQCSLTSIFAKESLKLSLYDFLTDKVGFEETIHNDREFISFVPCSLNVFKIQDKVIYNKLERAFKKLDFDYIVLDNSPNYSALSIAAIQASHFVFIPTQISEFDFDSLVFTITQIKDAKENLPINVILNRVGKAESKEETLFRNSKFLSECEITRFKNQNSIRKFISNRSSFEKNERVKESVQILADSIYNVL